MPATMTAQTQAIVTAPDLGVDLPPERDGVCNPIPNFCGLQPDQV